MTSNSATDQRLMPGQRVSDWGRMKYANVANIARPQTEDDLRAILAHAKEHDLKISVRGIGHNTVGQSIVDNGIMIDMMAMNQIIELNEQAKTLRVQAGATWAQLTPLLEQKRLSLSTKQEFNIFSVGGSLAANIHGKSIDYAALITHVKSFRILTADGEIIEASREHNYALFRAAIGGWGLLGIVVDVTFQLIDDRIVEKSEVVYMKREPLLDAYRERIQRDPAATPLCYGFLDTSFDNGYYLTYRYLESGETYSLDELKRDETHPLVVDILVWLQRRCAFVRRKAFNLTWATSGNPDKTLLSRRLLLWDKPPKAFNDLLLQKYYLPLDRFQGFLGKAQAIFQRYEKDIKLMMLHFRFQPANNEAMLASLQQEAMCFFPVYLAEKDDANWVAVYEKVSHELVEEVLAHGGSFYLTFVPATLDQVRRAFPHWNDFVETKRRYDPEERFTSLFYENLRAG